MNNHNFWLTLEPTVDVSIVNSDCFLYDTISKKTIEIRESTEVIKLLKNLKESNNVIKYNHSTNSKDIYDFVELLRGNYMGDIIPVELSKGKPFQMTNIINIQRDEAKLRTGDPNSLSIGEKIMSYLKEISLVLNNDYSEAILDNAFNQFPYCCTNEINEKQLNFNSITNFLNKINLNDLSNINILGSNISDYYRIIDFIKYLEPFKLVKNLFFHINVFYNHLTLYEKMFSMLNNKYWFRSIIFIKASNIDMEKIKICLKILSKKVLKFKFYFIIENEEDYHNTENAIKKMKLNSFSIIPYFNGENLDFFKDNIFLTKEDILSQELNLKKINSLKKVNPNFFGKIYVNNSGQILTNVNRPSVGHIDKIAASDALYFELNYKRSWFDVKETDKTCSNCLYSSICPPKSNYEYFFQKSNLCNID